MSPSGLIYRLVGSVLDSVRTSWRISALTFVLLEGGGADPVSSEELAVEVVGTGLVDTACCFFATPFARISKVFARTRLKNRLFTSI